MSVDLASAPFIGFPLLLRASPAGGSNLTKNDWVGIFQGRNKVAWDWIKPPLDRLHLNVDWLKLCQGHIHEGTTVPIRLEFYTGGGYITNGTKVAERTIVLRNPLHNMNVTVDTSGNAVMVSYSLLAQMPSSAVKITIDGVRLSTATVPATRTSGQLSMPLPRCHGEYEVSFLASSDSNAVLCTRHFEVKPSDATRSYRLNIVEKHGGKTAAAAVRPGSLVTVETQGALEVRDEVAIIKGEVPREPRPSEMQSPMVLEGISGRSQLEIRVPDQEGIYAVCLGLRHSTGASLPGAYAHLMVSKKACEGATTSAGISYSPPPPTTTRPSAAPDSTPDRFLCVVCRDNPVQMVVSPCHHLCVCETCSVALQAGNHPCPMCRQTVQEFIKVYV